MSQHGHQREQLNQNPFLWNNQQINYQNNKEVIDHHQDFEKDLETKIRQEFQSEEEDENKGYSDMNAAQNIDQYSEGDEQQVYNEEDVEDIYGNILDEFSSEFSNQQEFQQHNLMYNVPDANQEILFPDKNQKFTNQLLKQNYVNEEELASKIGYQNYGSAGGNVVAPKGSARGYNEDIYIEQENYNQQQNQMNLAAKLNAHITKRQVSTHTNTPSLVNWCENNPLGDNLNSCNPNNFQAAYAQSMQGGSGSNNQKQQLINSQQGNQIPQHQQYMRVEENYERDQLEQFAKNGSVLSSGNIPSYRYMEGNDIYSGQLSQRNAPSQSSAGSSSFIPKLNPQIMRQCNLQGNLNVQNQQNLQQNHNFISQNFMYDDKALCQFCQNSHRFFYNSAQIVSRLYLKYASSQNYYYTRDLNEILNNYRSKAAIHYKDMVMLDEEAEYLKRYYHQTEYPKKSKLLTEYYKFHKDIPRLFMLPETYILNNFHDKKRRFDYYRIAQLIEDENKKNPNRPPKGIVGEKPPLRTNESSEDKQEKAPQPKEPEKSQEYLLGEISSFINRGQGRLDDNDLLIEDDGIRFSGEEPELTDRFIQCINIQIQSGGNGNSIQAVSTTSLNSLGKKAQATQNKLSEGTKIQQQQQQQINTILQQKGKQQQQQQLQQPPSSSSQLQQYEISANAFLNYQKKLEQYKNSKKKDSGQSNNIAKQSIAPLTNSKQQTIGSQQQLISEKQKKKTARTDASLTIQELNMKLEEIVTSHSLISSRIVGDEDRQFDCRELDEFLKFLNKKEKENQNTINAAGTNSAQLNYQNQNSLSSQSIQLLQDNLRSSGKDMQTYQNPKDIYLTKNNNAGVEKGGKKNITSSSQNNQQLQQQLLQQAVQHNKMNMNNNPLLQQFQAQQSQVHNDTSRNNIALSSNQGQQHIQNQVVNQQNQQQQPQQSSQQTSVQKKMKVKPSKSEILNVDQFRSNPGSNNDIQLPHGNEINFDNYIHQTNLSPSQSNQQFSSQPASNYMMKNPNLSNQNQSKKRLTPQLRLDDIEYFNDNKMVGGKSAQQQQQLTGSSSVKFSHRDSLNLQQNHTSIRSARDQYPSTSTNKVSMKSSVDSKISGALFQQGNQLGVNSASKQQQQQLMAANSLIPKDQLMALSTGKQLTGFQQNLQLQDQFLNSNTTKNNYPNSVSSNSFAIKLDTKESQLFTPRQPQIQSTMAAQSNQKNLFSKCHQIILTKPPLSPRDSLPSPKNANQNNNPQNQVDNQNSSANNQNLDQQNQMNVQINSVQIDSQNPARKNISSKGNNLKKKQQSQQISSQHLPQQGIHNISNQNNNNSLTNNNQITVNQPPSSLSNLQTTSTSQLMNNKKGNFKHLNLKLKLDQLNFSKEKATNNDNLSSNQIIKEPLSQRSCSSKNLDQQTPKYNLYEMFKQQISSQAYTSMMLKPDAQQIAKPQTAKNQNSSSSQGSAFALINQISAQQQTQQKGTPSTELQQQTNIANIKLDMHKLSPSSINFLNQNEVQSTTAAAGTNSKPQKQGNTNTNQYQQIVQSPQPSKSSQSVHPSQMSPSYNAKLMVNVNNGQQINNNQQLIQPQQVMFMNGSQNSNSNNNSSNINSNQIQNNANTNGINNNANNGGNGGVRTTTNSTNRKSGAAFIHINNSGNNIQITSPKQQLEQQKKVISQQTTRSEANTRKNSQIKNTFEKSHHSTATTSNAAIPLASNTNINSKHVSRNSSLEMNNNPNVLRKKSPQLFKYQQKETKNVYNLVQQLSNNFTQSTPKQTVSARNYQTQRNSINHFDFQKPEIASFGSQNQLSSIQQSTLLQSPSYNNSVNINILQQGLSNKQSQAQLLESESGSEQATLIQQNPASFNNSGANNMKLNNNNLQVHNQNLHPNLTPSGSNLSQSVVQIQVNPQSTQSNKQNYNYLQFNSNNNIPVTQQQLLQQAKLTQSIGHTQNPSGQQTSAKVSSPQMIKKVANMHKHTKSENLMNLIIETNIQNYMNQQNQTLQTPSNQLQTPSMSTTLQGNQTQSIKKTHKNQHQAYSMMNNPLISNTTASLTGSTHFQPMSLLPQQQQIHIQHQQLQSQQPISASQLSPRVILNQNFQIGQSTSEKQAHAMQQQNQQLASGISNQLLHKKQSLASPLSSRSTQMNFQVELFRSTNNSTNNNNSNTNNTNSQHNNNPNSGVNNNSSSMNSQLNNNNINNNSNNSTAQQINSSLNANNFPTSSTNANTINQLNYVGLSVSSNSSNPQQQSINMNANNNIQKKGSLIQNQINGFFNMQSTSIKPTTTSSTVVTCSSNTNIISNNLLKTTYDNSLQASNINKKTKKKSMF